MPVHLCPKVTFPRGSELAQKPYLYNPHVVPNGMVKHDL